MKPLTIINVTDVTEKFNWKIFKEKCRLFSDSEYDQLCKTAHKKLNYLTTAYTYSCLAKVGDFIVEYKVQSGEEIATEKIYFLN